MALEWRKVARGMAGRGCGDSDVWVWEAGMGFGAEHGEIPAASAGMTDLSFAGMTDLLSRV